jgi:hypothetical protein
MPRKPHLVGNARFPAAHPIGRPFLGQVQFAVQKAGSLGGSIQQKDADLTVLASPGRAAVLPRHPRRFLPFLDESCFIDHQHPVFFSQVFGDVGAHVVAHRLLIPVRIPQQPLHPTWASLPEFLGQLPAVLALDWRQQALQEAARSGSHLRPSKTGRDARMQLGQLLGSFSDRAQFTL